jgi:hypothetical protein
VKIVAAGKIPTQPSVLIANLQPKHTSFMTLDMLTDLSKDASSSCSRGTFTKAQSIVPLL